MLAAAPVAHVTINLPDFWVKDLRICCWSRCFSAACRPPLATTLAATDHKTAAEMASHADVLWDARNASSVAAVSDSLAAVSVRSLFPAIATRRTAARRTAARRTTAAVLVTSAAVFLTDATVLLTAAALLLLTTAAVLLTTAAAVLLAAAAATADRGLTAARPPLQTGHLLQEQKFLR
jgi:hypothetical protein